MMIKLIINFLLLSKIYCVCNDKSEIETPVPVNNDKIIIARRGVSFNEGVELLNTIKNMKIVMPSAKKRQIDETGTESDKSKRIPLNRNKFRVNTVPRDYESYLKMLDGSASADK